ncbi:MAG: hypothetical protein ACRD3L_01865 [Terriglobales bacterium]
MNTTVLTTSTVPVRGIWSTIRSYVLWSHERGTVQYDVMVTLILLFVFFSPRLINFKDKPVEHNPRAAGILVTSDGQGGLIYQIDAKGLQGKDDAAIRTELLSIIEPVSGEVTISKYEVVRDRSGRILSYRVWIQR